MNKGEAIGNRQSAIGNRQSEIHCWKIEKKIRGGNDERID
jgi:hypothetical protein